MNQICLHILLIRLYRCMNIMMQICWAATVIKCDGKKVKQDKWNEDTLYSEKNIEYEDKTLTLIPYPYWGNRKHGEMLVWIKDYM